MSAPADRDPEAPCDRDPDFPVDAWEPDVLGAGFRACTLRLLPDGEDDDAVATLVHHVPVLDPAALPGTPTTSRFAFLYLHGWNDYFFQADFAREISRIGGAFYALDLRRYGRSLREGQMLGWVTSLTDYDEEIGLALAAIRAAEGWDTPTVLYGHSAGGLTASLWADRHPGAISALVLNSAWLEIQGAEPVRLVGQPVVRTLARRDPRRPLPIPAFPSETAYHLTDGWDPQRDGELPDPDWADDPYVTGWNVDPRWRIRPMAPIRPGWLLAILAGQTRVAAGLDVRCPVLSMGSARSHLSVAWTPQARSADTLVDADATARRAIGLGHLVTVARFEGGVHDLLLSAPPVREQVYSALRRWLRGYVLT
ncbi:alpha/beta hydrolase [Actinomyces sp.]|uniref:alpha/beta hydrolase n=1 Tax=Actinomyces sp. TaxID=29317 RepID=UPI0026DBA315|nr:alpha/beta hydrolase [Actinomyces sp.]MDO4901532.1 alpha/beta hydrolase [Actinomyces sp.]